MISNPHYILVIFLSEKTLVELIQPTADRISIVKDFLNDVKPCMEYNVVPITDGFGPTVTDPDMDLIVLSQETKKGGEMINEEREKRVRYMISFVEIFLMLHFHCFLLG